LGVFGDLLTRMPAALPVGAPAPSLDDGAGTPPEQAPARSE